jgi:integrase
VPLNVIQRQLGHANLGTTSILYITLLCAGDERPPSRPALTAAPLLAA